MTGITAAIHRYLVRPVGNGNHLPSKNEIKKATHRSPRPRCFFFGQFPFARAVDLESDPRTKQPTVAGDMVNKSVSGDLLPKWHAGDNIHALPAFAFAVAPGHPSVTRNHGRCCCDIPAGTKLKAIFAPTLYGIFNLTLIVHLYRFSLTLIIGALWVYLSSLVSRTKNITNFPKWDHFLKTATSYHLILFIFSCMITLNSLYSISDNSILKDYLRSL